MNLIDWDVNEGSVAGDSGVVNLGEVGSGWGSWHLGDELWSLGELLVLVGVVVLVVALVLKQKIGEYIVENNMIKHKTQTNYYKYGQNGVNNA